MSMKVIRTMNIAEATEVLRSMGMRITSETLREGIEQGRFPFGTCIRRRSGGPVYFVYQTLFDQWVAERASEEGVAS